MKRILVFFYLYITLFSYAAEDITLSWDIENNYLDSIFSRENVEVEYIDGIKSHYIIKKEKHEPDGKTDLYLSFDEQNTTDITGNYRVIYQNFLPGENKAVYKKSAYFIGEDKRVELVGKKNSFFKPGVNLGSFTISFYLYPVSYSNNEIILRIGAQYYDKNNDTIEDQSINARLIDGKIVWEFNNIFFSQKVKKYTMKLESYNRIKPEQWSHINVTYDSYTGIIKEYINGVEEGILIATEDGSIDSTVLNLRYHATNRCVVVLAPAFYGALDEFYILTDVKRTSYRRFVASQGEIISDVYDFDQGGIYLKALDTREKNYHNSNVLYYFRYAHHPFDPRDEFSEDVKWQLLTGENRYNIDNVELRYFQWKTILLPGTDNDYSPKFKSFSITYNKNYPPSRPKNLNVIYESGKIIIKWQKNTEKDIKGYKIYYGYKSNYYFGEDAHEGISPLDIGLKNMYEITGLDKHKIYYFAVTAYDDEAHIHESDFSEEIIIRPFSN